MYIVMYHYVRDLTNSRYPNIKGLNIAQFQQQIEFFEAQYKFISCSQVVEAVKNKKSLPDDCILLTFDDGYLEHYTNVFPILKEKKIPAFFSMPGKILAENKVLDVNKIHFILATCPTTQLILNIYELLDYYRGKEYFIESNKELYNRLATPSRFDSADTIFIKRLLQAELEEGLRGKIIDKLFADCIGVKEGIFVNELYMNETQVRFMAREGMEWGIHGYEHYWMNRLSENALTSDINKALDVFSGIIDPQKWICCYPYGSYSDEVIRVIHNSGAVGGLTTDIKKVDNRADVFRLPRLDTNDFPPKSNHYEAFR